MKKSYSAGLVSQSFWFVEFKKLVRLLEEGTTESEIKRLCLEENLFGAAKEYRARRMYGYLWNRVKKLDEKMLQLFTATDLTTQKIINLIAILKGDRLFFEFIFEVYREKIILGLPYMDDADIRIFFNHKETQDENVAAWTEQTKKRLGSVYFNFMTDANLLSLVNKEKQVTPPILDERLVNYLMNSGNDAVIKAILGVN